MTERPEGSGLRARPGDWGVRIEHVRGLYAQSQRRDLDPITVNFSLASVLSALGPLGPDAATEAGISPSNLKIVMDTTAAYPTYPDLGVPADTDIAWKALQLLARTDDRLEQLAKMAADPDYPPGWRTDGRRAKTNRITADRVRVLLGQRVDRKAAASPEERARALVTDLADERFRLALRNLRGNGKAAQAARAMADAYEKMLRTEERRVQRASDQAEKRIRAMAGKTPPSGHTYWEDLITRFDGALLFLAQCVRDAERIPNAGAGKWAEKSYRARFFNRGRRAIELGEKVTRALADVDPELVEGEATDDIPVVIRGMLPEVAESTMTVASTRVIRDDGDVADGEV